MLVSLLLMLAADPAAAPVAPTPTASIETTRTIKAVENPNKVICRAEEMTGSRLGAVRICMTKAQWDERSAADQQYLKNAQNQALTQ